MSTRPALNFLLKCEGEVAALMRSHDWSRSPLGPVNNWPQSLRSIVRLMLSSLHPMFLIWGKDLTFLYNDAYTVIPQKKHPDAFGKPFLDVWPEIKDTLSALVERALNGESISFQDAPFILHRNGYPEQTWFDFTYVPIHNDEDEIEGVYCILIETTRRVLAEQEKTQETERLQQMFHQAPGPIAIIGGPDHIFEHANNAYFQITGRDDILGKTVREVLPELEQQGFIKLLDQVFETGEPYIGKSTPVYLVLPKTGERKLVYFDFIYQPIRNGADQVTGIFFQGNDVTETLVATNKIRESELRLRQLANTIPHLAWMAEPGGEAHWYNDRWYEYTGTTPETMKQLGWGSFVKEDDLPVLLERWQTAIDTGSNYEVTVPLRSASGEYRTFYVSAAPLKDLDGNIVQWFGTNTDVTDLYRAQEELKSASRHKDEFLAMLAHELRNPLAPISAAATLMQMIQLNADQLKDTSNIISRQVRHMTGLIDDLMDVSRVTRGLIILNKMELDAKRIIYDAVEQVEPMMRAKRHHLNLELAPSSAHVFGDQKRLVQCLTNLLNNAAKYTPEGGEIHLRMDVKNEEVSLSIHDNGIGIAPDLQSRIFELFTQAERTADRSQGGLGIGLALVKSLVELHGGTVVCKSAGLGKGSQFTISLPRLLTQVELADGKFHSLATAQNAIKKLRILVVDDNVDAAKMLSFFLQAAGHEVMVEHGAKQALERARAEKPDVCILDIGLPEMDGNELARTLRQDTETANVFLVAVTGYGQEQDKKNALAAGFHQHLVKPVDTAKLLDLTNEICRR